MSLLKGMKESIVKSIRRHHNVLSRGTLLHSIIINCFIINVIFFNLVSKMTLLAIDIFLPTKITLITQ